MFQKQDRRSYVNEAVMGKYKQAVVALHEANELLLANGATEENIASFNEDAKRTANIIGNKFKWKRKRKSAADDGRALANEKRRRVEEDARARYDAIRGVIRGTSLSSNSSYESVAKQLQ